MPTDGTGPASGNQPSSRFALSLLVLSVAVLAGGCKLLDTQNPGIVADQLGQRTGTSVAVNCKQAVAAVQTEDSAAAVALANNAAFREVLADLGIAHSDVVEAGVIPNPELLFYAPVSPRPLESYLGIPIDAFFLRPKRVAIAKLDEERTRETVVQAGLLLVRDVRSAYADVLFALDKQVVARDAEKLRQRIADLVERRHKAGDASPVEVATARTDSARAFQEFARATEDVPIALERFHVLLGYTQGPPLSVADVSLPSIPAQTDDLVDLALQTRPDARAAATAVASAEKRQKLARCDWFRFFAQFYTYSDLHAVQYRPGFRMTIPIFNWNEGKIARADAEFVKAQAQQATVHDRIVLDVRQAFLQCQQAQRDLQRWQTKIRPTVEDAIAKAERSYLAGDTPLSLVLEASRQLLDTRLREAQLKADLRKAFAELERSVGRKIAPPPTLEFEAP